MFAFLIQSVCKLTKFLNEFAFIDEPKLLPDKSKNFNFFKGANGSLVLFVKRNLLYIKFANSKLGISLKKLFDKLDNLGLNAKISSLRFFNPLDQPSSILFILLLSKCNDFKLLNLENAFAFITLILLKPIAIDSSFVTS